MIDNQVLKMDTKMIIDKISSLTKEQFYTVTGFSEDSPKDITDDLVNRVLGYDERQFIFTLAELIMNIYNINNKKLVDKTIIYNEQGIDSLFLTKNRINSLRRIVRWEGKTSIESTDKAFASGLKDFSDPLGSPNKITGMKRAKSAILDLHAISSVNFNYAEKCEALDEMKRIHSGSQRNIGMGVIGKGTLTSPSMDPSVEILHACWSDRNDLDIDLIKKAIKDVWYGY